MQILDLACSFFFVAQFVNLESMVRLIGISLVNRRVRFNLVSLKSGETKLPQQKVDTSVGVSSWYASFSILVRVLNANP